MQDDEASVDVGGRPVLSSPITNAEPLQGSFRKGMLTLFPFQITSDAGEAQVGGITCFFVSCVCVCVCVCACVHLLMRPSSARIHPHASLTPSPLRPRAQVFFADGEALRQRWLSSVYDLIHYTSVHRAGGTVTVSLSGVSLLHRIPK